MEGRVSTAVVTHTRYQMKHKEVIQRGNGPVSVSTDTNGLIKVLPPKTVEEILARERERKARTTLLMALPEDHLAKFHKMTDAKEIWEAIKSRFGGNDGSKKMQKYILKQQFEGFSVSNSEGLHKGYDRFQSLLSQLEIHGAGVSTEDANQKFLRSLPSAWSQVSLIMRTKPGVDSLSFDDLYNNLRVFECDVKGSTTSSSSTQNMAFVSENTSSTNDVSTAYGISNSSGQNSQYEHTSSYSLLANQSSCPQLDHEDLEQLDEFDLEEMDLKWQVAMISMRMKKFYKKTGRKLQFDAKEPVGFDKTKVECYSCHKTGHFARECRSKGNQDSRRRDKMNLCSRHSTKDEGEGSERPSEPQPTPSPPHPSEAHVEPQSDPSPGPLPTIPIPDPIPKGFGRNHEKEPKQEEGLEDIKEEEESNPLAKDERKTDKVNEKEESTTQQQSTNRQDEGTDMQKVSSAKTKLSTDKVKEVPSNMIQAKVVSKKRKRGRKNENAERPRTTSTRSVLTLKPLPKIDPNDKGKKRIEEDEESDTESEEITEAKKKFDQIAHDEEVARKIQEEWEAEEERKRLTEEEATKTALSNEYDFIQARIEADRLLAERVQEAEREQFTVEEREKFLHDTIATQRRILAQQRTKAIRNKPPTKNHSTKDERKIKEMNEEASDSNKKKKFVKEDVSTKVPAKQDVAEQGTKDSEIMERKSFISKLDKGSSPEGDYLVVYRVNGNFRIQLSNGGDFWNDQQDWEIVTGERMRLVEFGILEIRMKTIDMQR
ncbi:ribonuclease H-like domain-containing protein [Tanacetum coccineum]